MWSWNDFWLALASSVLIVITVSIVAGSIANAVIKARKASSYRVKLSVTSLSGHEGEIQATFASAPQAQKFVTDWQAATGWASVR
jgi:hypothetical protein